MKYIITDENHPMKGLIFTGHVLDIQGEKRVWNDDSEGQSFPLNSCSPHLSLENETQLKRVKSYFPYRVVFGLFIDNEFCTFADKNKRRMNKFLKSGYSVFVI